MAGAGCGGSNRQLEGLGSGAEQHHRERYSAGAVCTAVPGSVAAADLAHSTAEGTSCMTPLPFMCGMACSYPLYERLTVISPVALSTADDSGQRRHLPSVFEIVSVCPRPANALDTGQSSTKECIVLLALFALLSLILLRRRILRTAQQRPPCMRSLYNAIQ